MRAQPIAIEDVIAYLLAALDRDAKGSEVFEIGGADTVTYLELMKEYARQRGLRRVMVPVPVLTPHLSSLWLGLVTPVYAGIGRKLVDSLRNETIVTNTAALDTFDGGGTNVPAHGEVHVSSRVVGFKKIKFYTNENVGSGELDLPEQQMHTTAYWLTVPAALMRALPYAPDDRRDGIVGLAFAMRQVAQLLLMCDRQDIGISIGNADGQEDVAPNRAGYPESVGDEPRIFVYDNYPGGIGFSEPLFRMHEDLVGRTRTLIAGCECQHGCPTCVGPIGNTGPLAKTVALRILELLVSPATHAPASVPAQTGDEVPF